MKSLLASIGFATVLMALGACSTAGNGQLRKLDKETTAGLLVVGRTTKSEVEAALGRGSQIHFKSGLETWHYFDPDGLPSAMSLVPGAGGVDANNHVKAHELLLLFDANGVLKKYALREQTETGDAQ